MAAFGVGHLAGPQQLTLLHGQCQHGAVAAGGVQHPFKEEGVLAAPHGKNALVETCHGYVLYILFEPRQVLVERFKLSTRALGTECRHVGPPILRSTPAIACCHGDKCRVYACVQETHDHPRKRTPIRQLRKPLRNTILE